jgi:hypothetical protein
MNERSVKNKISGNQMQEDGKKNRVRKESVKNHTMTQ